MDKSSTKLFTDAVAGELSTTVKIKFTTTTKDKIDTFLAYELTNYGPERLQHLAAAATRRPRACR